MESPCGAALCVGSRKREIAPLRRGDGGQSAYWIFQIVEGGNTENRRRGLEPPILRRISINEHEDLGDISTLSDPSVVEELVKNRKNT